MVLNENESEGGKLVTSCDKFSNRFSRAFLFVPRLPRTISERMVFGVIEVQRQLIHAENSHERDGVPARMAGGTA